MPDLKGNEKEREMTKKLKSHLSWSYLMIKKLLQHPYYRIVQAIIGGGGAEYSVCM